MSMSVALVEPEGELWSGNAEMVIARTLDGEIGLLTGHAPVIGILYEGSMVQIRPDGGGRRRLRGGIGRLPVHGRQPGLDAGAASAARRGRGHSRRRRQPWTEALQAAGAIGWRARGAGRRAVLPGPAPGGGPVS